MKILSFVSLAALAASVALAQDPPSRVARLNLVDGDVSFQPATLDTWTAATPNYPLTTGDHLYTAPGARAEMHIGANALRLGPESNFGFLTLDDQTVQVRFTEGSLEIRLRLLDDEDVYEIDTPQGAITLLRTGDYRVDTDPNRNATMVTVRSGDAEVSSNGISFLVHPRRTAYFTDDGQPEIRQENPLDDFDQFTISRNQREDRIPPPVHVSALMDGYEDLAAYGTWNDTPDYGWAWAPRVEANWAPYRDGRWAWVEPWGWTWIDDAPWGFAPFHYGRWARVGFGWVWLPGSVIARPVYAPALVAFVGGTRFGLGVGWFPLGPREPFLPVYRTSNIYIRQVNINHVNVVNFDINNLRYVNQRVPGAVTAVSREEFASARSVRQFGRQVSEQQLANAQIVGTSPQIAPRRESVLASERVNVRRPRQDVVDRAVVARHTPAPAPVRFEARQEMLGQNEGRPLAPDQIERLRQQQPESVVQRMRVRPATAAPVANEAAPQPNRPRQVVAPPSVQRSVEAPRVEAPRQIEAPRVEAPPIRRMDSRPVEVQPPPVSRPVRPQQQPEFRPVPENRPQAPEPRREQISRPAPPEPRREVSRPAAPPPAPEARPTPEARPAAPPAERQVRPEPRAPREDRRDEKKDR